MLLRQVLLVQVVAKLLVMERKSLSKNLASVALVMIKTLPMLLAFIYFIGTILCFFEFDDIAITYIKEAVILAYLYICSYLFQLCWKHRLFLHYIVAKDILNVYDYYIGIPLDNYNLCVVISVVSMIYFFFILYKFLKK